MIELPFQANPELDDAVHSEYPLTFKLDHRYETKQIRSMVWRLAYELLKPGGWKSLAEHWGFTKEQVLAIEGQWTGASVLLVAGRFQFWMTSCNVLFGGNVSILKCSEAMFK